MVVMMAVKMDVKKVEKMDLKLVEMRAEMMDPKWVASWAEKKVEM